MLLVANFLVSLFWLHPIHIGVTSIDYSEKEKALQVTHKFFVDDFEDQLEDSYGIKLHLGTKKEHQDANQYIARYLVDKFGVEINGKEFEGVWVGKEVDKEAIWIYIEYPRVKKIKSLKIRHEVMLEAFDDQKNLVHFKYQDFKRSLACKKKQPIGQIEVE